mmetsp:Transcript_25049/g.84415  ORF Transcript_25049/g.84415 Transcript_25049/m.84415 type:complete len:216 (+) Transcript_25049:303-950(+)
MADDSASAFILASSSRVMREPGSLAGAAPTVKRGDVESALSATPPCDVPPPSAAASAAFCSAANIRFIAAVVIDTPRCPGFAGCGKASGAAAAATAPLTSMSASERARFTSGLDSSSASHASLSVSSAEGRAAASMLSSCCTRPAAAWPRLAGNGALGTPFWIMRMRPCMSSASKGRREASMPYRMTPHDHMSDLDASYPPLSRAGAAPISSGAA